MIMIFRFITSMITKPYEILSLLSADGFKLRIIIKKRNQKLMNWLLLINSDNWKIYRPSEIEMKIIEQYFIDKINH